MSAVVGAREPSARYIADHTPRLVQAFDLLATAPTGLTSLREVILTLAIQGKLTQQSQVDEPAMALLQRIAKCAGRDSPEMEIDSPLPGWVRTTFGNYANTLCTGPFGSLIAKDEYVNDGVPLVNPSHMKNGHIEAEAGISVSLEKAMQLKAYTLAAGDIVFARRGEVGRTALVTQNEQGWLCGTGSFFARLHRDVNRAYLQMVFNSAAMRAHLAGAAVGATMVNLNQRALLNASIDIPPVPEQQRIVVRVEELMKLCDSLEQSGRMADEQHARLTSTLFDALVTSESAHTLAESWQRVAEHFDVLLDRPEAIDAFEQTILQLAVRGLLVPQESTSEREASLVSGLHLEPADQTAPQLPSGWVAARLPDLCSISGGSTPSKGKADFWGGSIPWVSPKDMKRDVIADAIDHVSEQALVQTSLSLVPTGSVLIVVRGMILAHSFPTAITAVPVTINQDMKALSPRVKEMAPYLALICRGFKREILSMVERSTHGTCKLETAKLLAWQFGLPPLAEQLRIVARVKELRQLCADLRLRLAEAREVQSCLADALVVEVV